jgi:peptidoglycan/xylan/chitin deacetylase (PgdA/CDA1 family)
MIRVRVGIITALVIAPTLASAEKAEPQEQTEDPALIADPILGGADEINGDEAEGMVAFTFDDGPHAGTTDKVIAALVKYDVPATFFVVGVSLDPKRRRKAKRHAALIQKQLELGFLVGNHTYGHIQLSRVAEKGLHWHIDRVSKMLHQITGAAVGLFRPPYGGGNKKSKAFLAKRGLTTVRWNLDSEDTTGVDSETMRENTLAQIKRKNGGVILFHDTKQVTAKTLPKILDDLEAYNCKRLAAGKPIIQPVSLHYFLRDNGKARAVPKEVEERTQKYKDGLQERCDARPADAATKVKKKKKRRKRAHR